MTAPMTTLREGISSPGASRLLFATDVLSQPASEAMLKNEPLLHHQCSRALPIASEDDIVVLQGTLDEAYYQWLRSLGLSTEKVVS